MLFRCQRSIKNPTKVAANQSINQSNGVICLHRIFIAASAGQCRAGLLRHLAYHFMVGQLGDNIEDIFLFLEF